MSPARAFSIVLPIMGVLAPAVVVAGEAWPNFRGPRHDGTSAETKFRTEWKAAPKPAWSKTVGDAFSSFACAGGRVFTCGTQNKKQVLFCMDAERGKIIWKKALEPQYKDNFGDGTRATPTIDKGRVYLMGAHGGVFCFNGKKGEEIWKLEFKNVPQWGYGGSVLVEGNLAIFSPGKADGTLLAVNKKTGKQVWKCGADDAGYATPYPFTFEGKRYVCGFAGTSALIAELSGGREVCVIPWKTDWKVNAAAPIFHDGFLLLSSGYRTGAGLFRLKPQGDKLAAEPVWQNKSMMNKFQSPVLHDGRLYVSDEKALKCVDFKTGEVVWQKRRIANGTLILAGGKLILLTEDGKLQIGPAGSDEFKPTAQAAILSDRCWSVPVLCNGRLYARNMEMVICLDLR